MVPLYALAGSGNVVKMSYSGGSNTRLRLNNPGDIDFVDYKSFSADVMLSSDSTSKELWIDLDYHTSIPEQPPGASWFCQFGLKREPTRPKEVVFAYWKNKNTEQRFWKKIKEIELDTWYNLRMDIKHKSPTEIQIDYYVDGELGASSVPEDSEILLDPNRIEFGPSRSFEFANREIGKSAIAYIDNVKAVYRNRIS